ncbi:HAD-IA family hydrolase [Acetobacter estunensis]|uniref:HAD-IA family hydrolase n=1 Tax=Acetobacter estunensis TaxID=104097 RepID=UPI001C2D0132|nr:HAD-IA family hydrolase [Acetobacter estunensis]
MKDIRTRLAVFDLDGTLVDSLPDLTIASNHLLAAHDLPKVTTGIVRSMIGDGVPALVQRLLDQAGFQALELDRAEATREFMSFYAPHATEHSRLFPGTLEALGQLRAMGWSLAVCTNKPTETALKILRDLDVLAFMTTVCGGDTFPVHKPDPAHLVGTIHKAHGKPSDTLMIGDHTNDMLAARNAGVKSVLAEWGYGSHTVTCAVTARLRDIGDLPRLAEDMLPGA